MVDQTTQAEIDAVRAENIELRAKNADLRAQLDVYEDMHKGLGKPGMLRRIMERRRIEKRLKAGDALADAFDKVLADLTAHGGYSYEDDFSDELYALAAYRATGDAHVLSQLEGK